MIKIIKWSAIGIFGLAIFFLTFWPTILSTYAWYSAYFFTEKTNPNVHITLDQNMTVVAVDGLESFTLGNIKIPILFENYSIEEQEASVIISDQDSDAVYIFYVGTPLLKNFLLHQQFADHDQTEVCHKLSKINGANPCDSDKAFLQVQADVSKHNIGLFSGNTIKLFGSIMLVLKSAYIAPDTLRIIPYDNEASSGFIYETQNGVSVNVFEDENTYYDIAAYRMDREQIETVIGAVEFVE